MKRLLLITVLAAISLGQSGPTKTERFRVLVTNDDGVDAPGISALVSQLSRNPNLELTVLAPATNQSGTGDSFTTTEPIETTASKTAAGFPAIALSGFPADTVLFGVLKELPNRPDLVVSGINFGPNFTDFINRSGTVGAALTAARLGIPAIAVSQGFSDKPLTEDEYDFGPAARYVANVVEKLRTKAEFQQKMKSSGAIGQRLVLNVNFPGCSSGSPQGVKVVPLHRFLRVLGYELLTDDGTTKRYQPVPRPRTFPPTNCSSKVADLATDYEALINGFATVTPLNPDLMVGSSLDDFRFLEKVGF
jgi:5'-nucleotidase